MLGRGVGLALLVLFCGGPEVGLAEGLFHWWVQGRYETQCQERGWEKFELEVEGRTRKLFWKAPEAPWTGGAVVALHGGGGSASNWCAGMEIGRPMESFSSQALEHGFAIFALDSLEDVATDEAGVPLGKRWDCMYVPGRENVDLPFMERVFNEVIPERRPERSSGSIFLTGISNGGYMTILAATRFADRLTAFAPVSCGDPYGTRIDAGVKTWIPRKRAPGVFLDRGTGRRIGEEGAAGPQPEPGENYSGEQAWLTTEHRPLPPFRQFHHRGDFGVDVSNMEKARHQLVAHGYRDAGPFLLPAESKRLIHHFWQEEYNRPLLEFFRESGRE